MYYPRKSWRARARRRHPGTLDRAQVRGLALHWPAMSKPLRTVADVKAALRSWQTFHMDTNGWSDIAYQDAFDQAGNRYKLRGLRHRSAANGSTDTNLRYGAILLVLAPGEEPSPAMIRAVRRHVRRFRKRYKGATELVGHGDIRPEPTDCPGAAVRRHLKERTFEP